MDSEENETSCSACREINGGPIRIACGHFFCLKCLQQVVGNNEKFPCPVCRFDVDLTLTNVDKLLKNVVFCNVIEARDTKEPSMCLDHNKSFDLFCKGCDAVICYKCLLMHHKGHTIEDIEIIFIERNKQLGAFLESTKHLASMAQDKCDAVKQSRISMEKNIDSISKTVESTFKKWNDALQKQQNVIFSYLHQEKDQKRHVFVEAERILADTMTTVTRLDTEINKLRSKDTAFVVQQYGSIKARQEDTEHKVLQEIETCFEPPNNLAIEVYAPWIEEAIHNIKHIDMMQTQATPGRQTIAEIQEEKVILKSDINELQNKIRGMGILMAALDEYVTSKTTNIILDIPNDIQLDPRFVLEHGQAKRIAQDFENKERETRQLQVENKYLKLILDDLHKSIIVGEATLQMELKPPEDIKNDTLLMELTTNTRKINLKFYELETELDYIHRTISQLTSMIVGDDRSKDQTQEKTNKFTATGRQPKRNPAKKFEQREQSSKIDKDIELVISVWRNLKEKEMKTNEVENLEYFNQCLDGLLQYLHDHVVSGAESSPITITQPAEIKPESSIAKRYRHAKDICAQFTKVENEINDLRDKTLVQGIILAALDEYVTTKKPNISLDIPNDIQLDPRFVLEHGLAKRIAQEFEKKERQLLGFQKNMEEKEEEYQQKLAKKEKSKTEVVAKLRKTEQALNEKSVTMDPSRSSGSNEHRNAGHSTSRNEVEQGDEIKNNTTKEFMGRQQTNPQPDQSQEQNLSDTIHETENKTTSNGNNGQHQTVIKSDRFQEQDQSDKIPEITADEERRMKRINEVDTLRGHEIKEDEERRMKLINELDTVRRQLKAMDEENKKLQDELSNKEITILQLRDEKERRAERPKSAYPTDHRDKGRPERPKSAYPMYYPIQRECERHCNEMDALKGKLKHYEHLITSLKEEKLNNEKTIIGLRAENNELLNRLSKIASDRLTHENTDITDLSDEIRPSKLTEKMSELYDNQWTSAFDEMKTNGFEDENAIGILLKIVMETNQMCKAMAFSHYQKLIEACTCFEYSIADEENKEKGEIVTTDNISIEMKQDIKRIWRESSKKVLKKVIPIIGRKFAGKFDIPLLQMKQTPLYMKECAELCWMMNIQEKPMHLDISVPEKDGHKYFDTEKFRSYTKTGQHVAFVVWPALYLFEGGSLLKKGVAEGLKVKKGTSGQEHSSVPRP